mmetsp:Transcript_12396/g.37197  ORF Transcript_12396/g.37197 Transcript_12396/m.37197 type:complete len:101 (-) Transcript_12396:505-807(-)
MDDGAVTTAPVKKKKKGGKGKASRVSKSSKSADHEKRKVAKPPPKPTDMEVLAADPTLRWERRVDNIEEEKRRIEDYKAKRRQRYADFWGAQLNEVTGLV